jgi:hypothetical protein
MDPDRDEPDDPMCLWSNAFSFEGNPPSIYIGYDDPCFDDFTTAYRYNDEDEGVRHMGALEANELTLNLFAFVSTTSPSAVFVRMDMEKGKRLSKALQPDNVDTQAKAFTAQVAIFGGAFGFIGGDPVAMLQNVQNMASSGQGKLK